MDAQRGRMMLSAPSFHGHSVFSQAVNWMAATLHTVSTVLNQMWVPTPAPVMISSRSSCQALTDREWAILTELVTALNGSEEALLQIRNAAERAHNQQTAQKISHFMLPISRSLYVTSSGRVHVKFTRKRLGDQPIGLGSSKIVYKAPLIECGSPVETISVVDAYVSVKRRQYDPSSAHANRQEFDHAQELLPIVRSGSFRSGVTKDSWLEEKQQGTLAGAWVSQSIDFSSAHMRREIAFQLTFQAASLHQQGYLHRDIKPENVLYSIDQNGQLKLVLADLGFLMKKGTEVAHVCGSLMFCSPEALRDTLHLRSGQNIKLTYATEAHDGWQLGATLLGLFFEHLDAQFMAENPKLGEWFACGGNMERLKQWNRDNWIDFPLTQDAWITEPQDKTSMEYILSKLLLIDPLKRWTPAQALSALPASSHDF
jgi:hypothetical protein